MTAVRLGATTLRIAFAARTISVPSGRRLRIGRHASNDLVLPDTGASRFHARIAWRGDCPVLEDLQSLNGTLCDGRKVTAPLPLEEGMRIRIGRSYLEVEALEAAPALIEDADDDDELAFPFELGAKPERGSFQGERALHRALLALEEDDRTGTVTVHTPGQLGILTLALGRVVRARVGRIHGLPALEQILTIPRGEWRFSPRVRPGENATRLSVRSVLRGWVPSTQRNRRHVD